MKNFKSSVPAALQTKIKAFADAVDFDDMVKGNQSHGAMMEQQQSEIEGNYVSGWMPNQDGGFTVSQYYQCDLDSSYHFTEKQTEWANAQSDDCMSAFKSDNDIDSEASWDDLTDEQKNEYGEYENEWFSDGALLELQIFVEGYTEWKGDPQQVTIRLSINYKDAPYFRQGDAEDIKQRVLTVDEFMAADIPALIAEFSI